MALCALPAFTIIFLCILDVIAGLEFVSPVIEVVEGAKAEVCTRLMLLNNYTTLTQNITTVFHIMSGPESSKAICTRYRILLIKFHFQC